MALTQGRKTPCLPSSEISKDLIPYPIAGSTSIYLGGLVGVNATGFLVPMGPASLKCVGVAWYENGQTPPINGKFDNSAGSDGAFQITVRKGIQFFANYASDPVVVGDLMHVVYAFDDYTVQHTSGSNSPAGYLVRIVDGTLPGDGNYGPGCWVDVGAYILPATTITSLQGVAISATPGTTGQVLTLTSATAAAWATDTD